MRGLRRRQNQWLHILKDADEALVLHRLECAYNNTYSWGRDGPSTIGDLKRAEQLYRHRLRMNLRTRSIPGALFLAAGDYHHHVGLNTWAGSVPPAWRKKHVSLGGSGVCLTASCLHCRNRRPLLAGSLGKREPL